MGKHILVISQYFYPEQFRINDICSEWVKRGYKVTVISGIPNYPEGKYYDGYNLIRRRKEKYNGIDIIRIPLIPRGKGSAMLALNYLSFVFSGFIWNIFTRIKADCVFICEVSPMTQALPGVWYAKKRKIPCYLYVQDLWPENIEIVAGITNKIVINSINKMVNYIYRHCTKIFATSDSFVDCIVKHGVPSEKVECWPQYAEDFYRPLKKVCDKEIEEKDTFSVIFTGNVGNAQGLDVLPKTAVILKKKNLDKRICFNIVGDGRYKEELIKLVKLGDVSDMFNFIDKQPAICIPELISQNDAAFISFASNKLFEMTIPAKLQSYLACGIPIIASADGETSKIVLTANAGVCSPVGDENRLAEIIIELSGKTQDQLFMLGVNARKYYDENFNKNELLNRMDYYLAGIPLMED